MELLIIYFTIGPLCATIHLIKNWKQGKSVWERIWVWLMVVLCWPRILYDSLWDLIDNPHQHRGMR